MEYELPADCVDNAGPRVTPSSGTLVPDVTVGMGVSRGTASPLAVAYNDDAWSGVTTAPMRKSPTTWLATGLS